MRHRTALRRTAATVVVMELSVLVLELLVVRFTRVDIHTMGDISFVVALVWMVLRRATKARSGSGRRPTLRAKQWAVWDSNPQPTD